MFPDRFGDCRWIHWESDGSIVCLREVSLIGFLVDSCLCVKTDGKIVILQKIENISKIGFRMRNN